MTEHIRWGVLGASKFAMRDMIPAIHRAAGGQVVAVASRSAAKADPLKAFIPGLEVESDYQALLDRSDIDAIYIPLPNHLHVPWSLKAMAAGKHVLSEKPIALQAKDIETLITERDRTGVLAAEAFMVTHHPQWMRSRELVQSGELGRLRHIQGVFTFYNDNLGDIRNQAQTGGGGLRDIGVYPTVTARYVTGEEPTVTHADIQWANGVDVVARVQAQFPSCSFDFMCSMQMLRQQEMVFFGEKGTLKLTAPFNPNSFAEGEIILHRADKSIHIERFTGIDQYQLQVEAFHHSAKTGTPYACPLEFSLGNQQFIDAVYQAASTS